MNAATKYPQTIDSSPGASPSQNMPPRPRELASAAGALSPSFSRVPFSARHGAAASSSSPEEHPCVTLLDWWLERVEGDQRKIAVSGFTERNGAFTSAAIVKRYEPLTVVDEGGLVVCLWGDLSTSRMLENGFSPKICEQFLIGFPSWWESWDSYMESHQNCFNTSNLPEGSTQFYLAQFQLGNFFNTAGSSLMTKLLEKAKNFSSDYMDAFMKSSSSSNETSRFEEYTCSNDISAKEKSAPSNHGCEGSADIANEVDNVEMDMIMSSTSQERGHVDIEHNVCLAPTENCTSVEMYKEAGNKNDNMHPDARDQEADRSCERTPVALKNQGHLKRTEHVTLDKKAVGPAEKQRYAQVSKDSTGSSIIRSQISYMHEVPLTLAKVKSLSISTPESHKSKRTRSGHAVVPSLDEGSQRIVYDSVNKERSADVANEVDNVEMDLTMSSTLQEWGHVDIECNVCLAPTEKCTSDKMYKEAGNQNDNMHPDARDQEADRSCERTPVASLKNQGRLKRTEHITLNQKAVGPAEKQRYAHEVPQGSTRSPIIRSQISYAHEVPLTRGMAKSLSISTPESLKMKRTRSGRVVVPALDQGSQRIVYDSDGLVSGVSPMGVQSPVKGSKSVTPARKRRAR